MTKPAPRIPAAVYLRVSLDRTGEHLAVDRQREDCRAIAKQRGWDVVEEYVDNSISASDARKNRPGYNRLVEDFERGFIKAEIVSFEDLDAAGSMAEAKAAGKVRIEGKDYVMRDGDVVEFRFNV